VAEVPAAVPGRDLVLAEDREAARAAMAAEAAAGLALAGVEARAAAAACGRLGNRVAWVVRVREAAAEPGRAPAQVQVAQDLAEPVQVVAELELAEAAVRVVEVEQAAEELPQNRASG
jgi:hypothetical protein